MGYFVIGYFTGKSTIIPLNKWVTQKMDGLIMENWMNMDDLGVSLLQEPLTWGKYSCMSYSW